MNQDLQGKYQAHKIEPKWQDYWLRNKTFRAELDTTKEKYYILDMFPYPSGAGLHVGHPEGYTASDILARYKRMRGFNVLHPMGWDAFGLPAEQYALKTGTHPAITTEKNINNFRRQIQSLGFSYDWDREICTSKADYYKWTQWIFSQLYKKGLAYMDIVPVNWCPELGTVLANEEVIDGKSERGGHDVVRRPMRQWMLRITEYADSLLEGIEDLDWPEGIKEMQRNWIGKSLGAEVLFSVKGSEELEFQVFTTRPDTLFGATYCVLAPEHELVEKIVSPSQREAVEKYVSEAKNKSDRLRQEEADKKTGVFSGAYAINPVNEEEIPIYVADYVLISYGSGAIMAVPGHDQRDWDFAKKFQIHIREVVSGGDISEGAYSGEGKIVNSEFLNDLSVASAKKKIISWLQEKGLGKGAVNYKLRDWLFSRQRYWGEPFPVVHSGGEVKLLPESELPVLLPEVQKYQPTEDGEPPLARAGDWLNTQDPETGEAARRETNTMPQWAGSCWYYLRYLSPKNDKAAWDKEEEEYWMPVDLYIGGAEHAVLHLLYSRFWHHVLYDLGLVSTKEPFRSLVNQGMILGEDNQKMSKARGNVVNPDDIVQEHGADTLRLYEMFMGPLEQVKPWQPRSVGGSHKFLSRVWKLFVGADGQLSKKVDDTHEDEKILKLLHQTIKKVTNDIENLRFHTAIAALMTLLNELSSVDKISKEVAETYVLLLSPFAPHIGEELWEILGNANSLAYREWPQFNAALAKQDVVTIVVQVNGKVRAKLELEVDLDKEALLQAARESEKLSSYLSGRAIKKEIVVPNKLVNFVVV